ncbi:hypothetical protein KC678_01615 [Candidatus Dojkabacteria bacterium]|uniref:Uncharacterized protein n=1 Tax=Candidatus Dojkabacteria bacterium TaxID=2099670 RepID=A0A955IAB8_9BACT|nr:hypothetical protein [Candidatus Dojkabacteria bacterium]
MSATLKPNPNDPDEVITDDSDTIKANVTTDPAYQKDSYSSSEVDEDQADSNPSDQLLNDFEQGVEAAGEEPEHQLDPNKEEGYGKYRTPNELDTAA